MRCLSIVLALFLASAAAFAAPENPPLVVAYVFPQKTLLAPGQIDPAKITRINYAFANIQDGVMVTGYPNDEANFAFLTALRHDHPSLTVLVSVGGWLWSTNFSDVALTPESRRRFIDSVAAFLAQYQLDGLDIDWEYPGLPGAGHTFRAEDKQNLTALLKELRERFNRESRKSGHKLYLTIAAGATDDFLAHTEMGKAARYLDTINVMSYDYYIPGAGPITGHHAALYSNPADPDKLSADASIQAFERAGVPANKILLGVPFYGRAWGEVTAAGHGLYQPGKPAPSTYASYTNIETDLLSPGFTRYWDPVSRVPWIYNNQTQVFVTYEDEQSITEKCKYVREHHLRGVMFWDLEEDPSGKLLDAIHNNLH
jgi:chitinase